MNLNCVETSTSSVITSFCYDEASQILAIAFKNGGIYNYYDVPASVFEEMSGASSKGQFFLENVRDRYRYARI